MDPLLRLPDVDALIQLINEGAFDNHLEDILAAAHGRKRERRGRRHPYGVIDLDRREYEGNWREPERFSDGDGVGAVEQPIRPVREHVIPGRACG